MLRTLTPPESELLRLCHLQTWGAVSGRSQSHPLEAQPSEAALRGEGSTALASAVRSGAPVSVLEALLQANEHQIALTHRQRGSVLHEAIQYHGEDEALDLLLTFIMEYQNRSARNNVVMQTASVSSHAITTESQFMHVGVQEQRLLVFPNLLGTVDGMKRTALHLFVERIKRQWSSATRRLGNSSGVLPKLIHAYPEAITMTDLDGNTPLMALMLTPRCAPVGQVEREISQIALHMLDVCPGAATVAQSVSRPWQRSSFASHPRQYYGEQRSHGYRSNTGTSVIAPLPLYYAVLHGRSLETLQLLLRDHRLAGSCGSSTLITQFHEVPLHVAVTTRAPLAVLHLLLQDCPDAVLARDAHKLNPLDWQWIRYVIDCNGNPLDALSSRIVSRRRFVPTQIFDWHDLLTRQVVTSSNTNIGQTPPTVPFNNPIIRSNLQDDLLQRLQLMLPVAASVRAAVLEAPSKGRLSECRPTELRHWSFLHAACFVPCPIAVVRLALHLDHVQCNGRSLRSKDAGFGRFPLHFAVSRAGYGARVCVGTSQDRVQAIQEASAALDVAQAYPEACKERDGNRQLPLHIWIDTHKIIGSDKACQPECETEQLRVIEALVRCYPDALDQRDGKSNLYPWQQAAVGEGASLNAIFTLLRASGRTGFHVFRCEN